MHATDIDGDKDIDLAISNALSNDVSLFFNDSGANFALSGHLPVGDQPNDIALCDIDNDGGS